jgi:enoyl-CoA hydratase/carnithine racemase
MIQAQQDARVRRITLAAPQRRNILNAAMARDLLTELANAEADPNTGAILINAEGPVFCAGLDFDDLPEEAIFTFGKLATKPIVAAMQGVATSAGVALLANAHIVIAAQGSSFGLTDIREGRIHKGVLSAVESVLGPRRTRELALTGRIFTTPDSLNWGLVHAATPAFELDDRVQAAAHGLAGANAEAVRAVLASS